MKHYFEKLKVKYLKVKKLRACQIGTDALSANTIDATQITVNGSNIQQSAQVSGLAANVNFPGCTEINPLYPSFGDRSPIKPASVPQSLWNSLLDGLKVEQDRLTQNFIAGRRTLGLPQCEKIDEFPVNLIGTISMPLVQLNKTTGQISYRTSIGWDLHCVNTFYNSFTNPETVYFRGMIDTNGNLQVVSISSGTLEFGQVVKGTGIPWGTTISDQISGTPGGPGVYSLDADAQIPTTLVSDLRASKWGPKNVSIFIQVGTIRPSDGSSDIRALDRANRQFEPTIDWSGADPQGNTHTGEDWNGNRVVPTSLVNELFVENNGTIPVLQIAIFAEDGVAVYYTDNCTISNRDRSVKARNLPENAIPPFQSDTAARTILNQTIVSARSTPTFGGINFEYTLNGAFIARGGDALPTLNFSGFTGDSSFFNIAGVGPQGALTGCTWSLPSPNVIRVEGTCTTAPGTQVDVQAPEGSIVTTSPAPETPSAFGQ